jgi:hypothetical protein
MLVDSLPLSPQANSISTVRVAAIQLITVEYVVVFMFLALRKVGVTKEVIGRKTIFLINPK